MKRVYLDWGIISNLKKEENSDLREFFLSHKNRLFFVYSPAHFDDLMRSEGDSRLKDDLDMLTSLVDDHLLAFNKNSVGAFRETIPCYYEKRKKEPSIKLAEYGDLLTLLDTSFPGCYKLGSKLKKDLQSLSFPIPQEIISNDELWGSILPDLPNNPSALDVIQAAGLFVDRMQDESNYYKSYRSKIHHRGFKLDDDSGNWTEDVAIPNISHFLKSKGVDKSFRELVEMPFAEKKNVSEYELFVAAYTMLDMLGFHSDKLSKQGSTINSLLSDAQHAFLASYCDCFITDDRRLRSKAGALYNELDIKTRVLASSEAFVALQDDIQLYNPNYFFSFLQREFGREDFVVESHTKESDQEASYKIYHFSQRLLGIFSRGILYTLPENEQVILLDVGTDRSTSFLFYDEVAMIVDLVSGYLSAEPIPDYSSIKEAFVRGDSDISVIWTIGSGKIILKNDKFSHKPELVVVQSIH